MPNAAPVAPTPVRLVCIDVDGTLVGTDRTVHPDVWRAADRARAAGIRLALSSGRPGFGITRELAARLDATGWHCFQNGASILSLETGRSRSQPLPEAAVAMLLKRARDSNRLIELYTDDDYAFEGPPARARAHAQLLGLPFRERPVAVLAGAYVRAQWLVPHEQTALVLSEPHPGLEVSLSSSPAMPDTRFINLTAAGTDKARAVRTIASEYQVPMELVMFVGDSDNDASAMRAVGWPVAMANAEPAIHELARVTVGHVDRGGLAEALLLATA